MLFNAPGHTSDSRVRFCELGRPRGRRHCHRRRVHSRPTPPKVRGVSRLTLHSPLPKTPFPTSQKQYLFDWSLPLYAPELLDSMTIPCFFAQDFLQRLEPGSKYREVWPSLFVAAAGLRSGLHIDAFGSNFWMALFHGVKRWRFYDAEDVLWLQPDYMWSWEPLFDEEVCAASGVAAHEVDLQAGDLLFVPAGSPHTVENFTDTLAVGGGGWTSSNYHP